MAYSFFDFLFLLSATYGVLLCVCFPVSCFFKMLAAETVGYSYNQPLVYVGHP
jgi:hypothetical protein